jgi:hypothetical protein
MESARANLAAARSNAGNMCVVHPPRDDSHRKNLIVHTKKIQFEEPYSFLAVLSDYFCQSLVIQVGISTLMSSTYSTHVLAGLVSNGI